MELTMDDLLKQVAELQSLRETNDALRQNLDRERQLNHEFELQSGEWNTISLVGRIDYVHSERFNIDGVVKYQIEFEQDGELEFGDIAYVSGEIIGKRHWEEDEFTWLLIKGHKVSVISKSNSGITDVTKRPAR